MPEETRNGTGDRVFESLLCVFADGLLACVEGTTGRYWEGVIDCTKAGVGGPDCCSGPTRPTVDVALSTVSNRFGLGRNFGPGFDGGAVTGTTRANV